MLGSQASEDYVDAAVAAVRDGEAFEAKLDAIPAPVYVTDADGLVTYWNHACVAFAGRTPRAGKDRWCVTWRIFTTAGDLLPHDRCPMAAAIKQRQPVRNEVAIAMRPDGSRVAFIPYPTPIFGADGELVGAVNLLVDVSEQQSAALSEQAGRCRRLASATYDRATTDTLSAMADGFEQTARSLGREV